MRVERLQMGSVPYKKTSQHSFHHVRTQQEDVPLHTRKTVLTKNLPMLVLGLPVRGNLLHQPRLRQEQHVYVAALPPALPLLPAFSPA